MSLDTMVTVETSRMEDREIMKLFCWEPLQGKVLDFIIKFDTELTISVYKTCFLQRRQDYSQLRSFQEN